MSVYGTPAIVFGNLKKVQKETENCMHETLAFHFHFEKSAAAGWSSS